MIDWLIDWLIDWMTTRTRCRARRDERVESYLFQHGGRRTSSSACAYSSLVFCTVLWICISLRNNFWKKSEVNMSTHSPRCGDAPEYVSCESRLSWRACCAVLFDKRDTSRHVMSSLFPVPKCTGKIACRDVTWRAKWNLGFLHVTVDAIPLKSTLWSSYHEWRIFYLTVTITFN